VFAKKTLVKDHPSPNSQMTEGMFRTRELATISGGVSTERLRIRFVSHRKRTGSREGQGYSTKSYYRLEKGVMKIMKKVCRTLFER